MRHVRSKLEDFILFWETVYSPSLQKMRWSGDARDKLSPVLIEHFNRYSGFIYNPHTPSTERMAMVDTESINRQMNMVRDAWQLAVFSAENGEKYDALYLMESALKNLFSAFFW